MVETFDESMNTWKQCYCDPDARGVMIEPLETMCKTRGMEVTVFARRIQMLHLRNFWRRRGLPGDVNISWSYPQVQNHVSGIWYHILDTIDVSKYFESCIHENCHSPGYQILYPGYIYSNPT
jgi:hypothetical protein